MTEEDGQAHEDLCEKCGRCCRFRLQTSRGTFHVPFHCPFLDRAAKLCTVYDRRHDVRPQCATVARALENEILPDDCPYVLAAAPKDYHGPKEWPDFWDQSPETIQAIADSYDPPISDIEVAAVKREVTS